MKRTKTKILMLVLAMVFSTFASGLTVVVIDGNDSMTYKVDPPKSKMFYFNELMEEVEGPTDYWIDFVIDDDELSFTSQNLDIAAVSVKGGPNYNLYTDLDDSESGLTAPINPKNNMPYGISHYSFDFSFTPPPPPESEITVTKTVIDESEQEIDDETEFSFKLEMKTGPNEWTEVENDSPFTLKGGESKTITGLLYGEYRITEESEVGYTVVGDEEETVVLENEEGETVDFTNMLDEEPWLGEIRIEKSVDDPRDEEPSLAGFEFILYSVIDEEETLVEAITTTTSGSIVFEDLPAGHYKLYETDKAWYYEGIDEEGEMIHLNEETAPNGYIDIDVENEKYYPEDWLGNIRIQKSVTDSRNSNPSLEGFVFTLYKVLEGEDQLIGSRTTNSTGTASYSDLEEGQYMLFETDIPDFSEGIPTTGRLINLNPDTVDEGSLIVNVTNTRVYPPDDDDDDPRPRPRPRPEPEEEDEDVLEIVVIEEPVPEAPPVIEVVEEVVPLATLPKTAAADQLIISGLGSALFAIGLLIKKRR